MVAIVQSLFAHQEWADKALLAAVRGYAAASVDDALRKTLHHIVMVQRFYVSAFLKREFNRETELRVPDTLDELDQSFAQAHAVQAEFAAGLSASALQQPFHLEVFKDFQLTLWQATMQVILHSQNHRGQCLTRLRELGAKPPMLDFLLWAKDNPGTH